MLASAGLHQRGRTVGRIVTGARGGVAWIACPSVRRVRGRFDVCPTGPRTVYTATSFGPDGRLSRTVALGRGAVVLDSLAVSDDGEVVSWELADGTRQSASPRFP